MGLRPSCFSAKIQSSSGDTRSHLVSMEMRVLMAEQIIQHTFAGGVHFLNSKNPPVLDKIPVSHVTPAVRAV